MASDEDAERYLKDHVMRRRTPNTITTRKAFAQELKRVRDRWCATDMEEYEHGLACLAVPIGPPPSTMVLGISAPRERLEQNFDKYLDQLRSVADQTSPFSNSVP